VTVVVAWHQGATLSRAARAFIRFVSTNTGDGDPA
jgi:hypothetical protein